MGFLRELGKALGMAVKETVKQDVASGGPLSTAVLEGLKAKNVGAAAVGVFQTWPAAVRGFGSIHDAVEMAKARGEEFVVMCVGDQQFPVATSDLAPVATVGEKLESGASRLGL